jgi:hypothetical protein
LALGAALLFLAVLLVFTDRFAISSSPLNLYSPTKSVCRLFRLPSAYYTSGSIINPPYFGNQDCLHNYFILYDPQNYLLSGCEKVHAARLLTGPLMRLKANNA